MNKKERLVAAIEHGTVIDHIPADKTYQVASLLGLFDLKTPVTIGFNYPSQKVGNKGIIKVSDKYFNLEDVNKIGLVAPTASIIEIKDYEVIKKQTVTLPESIEHIVKCFNPNCVTNKEHDVPTKFKVIKDAEGNIKLHCHYCEKNTTQDKLEFI